VLPGTLLADRSAEHQARAFLAGQNLERAASKLSSAELSAIGQTLRTPNRRLTDNTLANLLRNPVAWKEKDNGRQLLGSILTSLPELAGIEGIENTVKLASNHDISNYRGYGVEIIGSAALNGFVTTEGKRAQVTRMGGMVKGTDGRRRESDGAALIGADGIQRLVSIKSVSTPKAVTTAMRKATDQLALRNYHRDGSRSPGVIVVGYDSPEVLRKLKRRDWQAAANRTGAKLLVLGINQHTGASTKLASYMPDPRSTVTPKRPGPRPPLSKRVTRFLMKQIGKRHPPTARRISRMRSAFKRCRRKLGAQICSLFGRKK
jgi:hypothetical protein